MSVYIYQLLVDSVDGIFIALLLHKDEFLFEPRPDKNKEVLVWLFLLWPFVIVLEPVVYVKLKTRLKVLRS